MTFYRERICEYELKNISIYFGNVYFCQIQPVGLIEAQLDFGLSTDRRVIKSAYLHKSCLRYPQRKFKMNCVELYCCCCCLNIVLLTLFSMTWLFVLHTYLHSIYLLKRPRSPLFRGTNIRCKGFQMTSQHAF